MKSNKQLDEMQESKLLKIQEKGFWLVFWILFAAIFVQALIGMTLKEIAGEIVVLVAASIYIAAASLKNGLWTRNIQPTIKSNLATSIIPALILATVYKGNIIKNLIMDCQSYTKYRPNETTGGIFVSWRRKEELPTGA